MFGKHKTDVLVVGAGPVGMFTALSLAKRDAKVEIIDAQWRPAARSFALALHPGSLELLHRAGLAEALIEDGHRVDAIAFYEGKDRRAEVRYDALGGRYPFLLILPQQRFEDALEAALRQHGIQVKWNHRLARMELGDDHVTAHVHKLEKETMGYAASHGEWVVARELQTTAACLVGADGHNSLVRRILGVEFPELGQAQFFGVFELAADTVGAEVREVRVVLEEARTNVLWPLGGGRFRWSFQMEQPDHLGKVDTRSKSRLAVQIGEDVFPYLDRSLLRALMAERAPWFRAEIGEILWSVGVRFERRLAERFGQQRAWLAGDAAHMSTPVGVHSMNMGLREGAELAERMSGILRGHPPAGGLAAYGGQARQEWCRLLGLEGSVEALPAAAPWLRQRAARIPAVLPATGSDQQALMAQLGLTWR
jgi:2-polyprenyl-6-methoxyphenol hydroxylase-like FAD-dependent oxidoreductase